MTVFDDLAQGSSLQYLARQRTAEGFDELRLPFGGGAKL